MSEARVTGIGGIFFRAKDPEALGEWYRTHFGVNPGGPWKQDEGYAVFAPFAADTDYWSGDRQWMLNLRVEGLDALVARLEGAGIAVRRDPDWEMPGVGRFARVTDPEGNEVELWEPERV